jgi:hypothetical protein
LLRGQGATEYLVLLAVVLIIALVSIALLGFFPGIVPDAKITQSTSYWKGEAYPIAIDEAVPLILDAPCDEGDYGVMLVIKNNGADTLTFRGINFNRPGYASFAASPTFASHEFCQKDASGIDAPFTFAGGEKKTIRITLDWTGELPILTCSAPKQVMELDVKFLYDGKITDKVQTGAKKLFVRCP